MEDGKDHCTPCGWGLLHPNLDSLGEKMQASNGAIQGMNPYLR